MFSQRLFLRVFLPYEFYYKRIVAFYLQVFPDERYLYRVVVYAPPECRPDPACLEHRWSSRPYRVHCSNLPRPVTRPCRGKWWVGRTAQRVISVATLDLRWSSTPVSMMLSLSVASRQNFVGFLRSNDNSFLNCLTVPFHSDWNVFLRRFQVINRPTSSLLVFA